MIRQMIFTLALALAVIGGAAAQDATSVPGEIVLEPFTDEAYMVSGVAPGGWTKYAPGLWLHPESTRTLLAQQGAVARLDEIVAVLLPQLTLSELPEPGDTLAANDLEWTLYSTEGPAGTNIVVDFALASNDTSVFLVILQTDVALRDSLRDSVFLPAVAALKPAPASITPPDDAPYTVEDVTFPSGDITLAGTLTLPEGEGPHPAVILVSGSGPQDRDERLTGVALKPFAVLADHLTRNGITVLRFDDRGYAQSGGDFSSATTADFADDAAAAVAYLQTRQEIDAAQIGVLGHSEGGAVAAHLAADGAPVAFYVLMAGPGVNGADILIVQNRRLYAAEGLTDEEADAQIAFVSAMFPLILNGDAAGIERVLEVRVREQVAALPESQLAQIPDVETFIAQTVAAQLADFGRPWWPYFLRYDPAEAWAAVTVPVLALFGGLDVQVDADQNAEALRAALEASPAAADFEIVTFEEANHLFQHAVTGAVSEYGTLEPQFIDGFLQTVTDWILEQVTLP